MKRREKRREEGIRKTHNTYIKSPTVVIWRPASTKFRWVEW